MIHVKTEDHNGFRFLCGVNLTGDWKTGQVVGDVRAMSNADVTGAERPR